MSKGRLIKFISFKSSLPVDQFFNDGRNSKRKIFINRTFVTQLIITKRRKIVWVCKATELK